ncbi:TPA: hypothetical protein DDZ86_03875 [Candidatus Dependentiae bacterium]|nr:hypothetical protein [Candidatus Dependentiae bacterium]
MFSPLDDKRRCPCARFVRRALVYLMNISRQLKIKFIFWSLRSRKFLGRLLHYFLFEAAAVKAAFFCDCFAYLKMA